jgi:hypothetical protein
MVFGEYMVAEVCGNDSTSESLTTILKGGTCPRWVQFHVLRILVTEDTSIISEPIRPKLGLGSGCHRRGGCRRRDLTRRVVNDL